MKAEKQYGNTADEILRVAQLHGINITTSDTLEAVVNDNLSFRLPNPSLEKSLVAFYNPNIATQKGLLLTEMPTD